MKIVVLLKRTPDTETKIQLSADGKSIDHSSTKFVTNPYDEFAIEEALQIKKAHGGEVVIASFAPEATRELIVKGLAMGADRGLIIKDDGLEHADSLTIAKVLAAAIKAEAADLVLCGKQAIDDDNMHVGTMVAELLGWPSVNVAGKVTAEADKAVIEREVEGGQVEVHEVRLPAVVGANKSLNQPRFAALPGIMKAKRKPFDIKAPADYGLDAAQLAAGVRVETLAYTMPPEKPPGQIFKDQDTATMVAEVVKRLREEAKVI